MDWKTEANRIADWAKGEINKAAKPKRKKATKRKADKIARDARREVFKAAKMKKRY